MSENAQISKFFGTVLKAVACTRNNNPDDVAYERGVIEPCRRIRAMMKECGVAAPSVEQMRETLTLLDTVFVTKQVPAEERVARIQEILERNSLRTTFPERAAA